MPRPKYSEEIFLQRFWDRVDKISDSNGCWLWTAGKTKLGYGQVVWNGKVRLTHIVSYLLSGNTIPYGLELAHSEMCIGKRHCCNPTHLTPKTHRENMLDKNRDNKYKSHIPDV